MTETDHRETIDRVTSGETVDSDVDDIGALLARAESFEEIAAIEQLSEE